MSAIAINAAFEVLAILNCVPDNEFTYQLIELPHCAELRESLSAHFGPGINFRTKTTYSADDWQLRLEPRGTDPSQALAIALPAWVFANLHAPQGHAQQSVERAVIELLLRRLNEAIGPCEIYEVFVSPPHWYESSWQDFVLRGESHTWLLHLGVSD